MSLGLGLSLFTALCDSATHLEALRDQDCPPGSDQWTAVTLIVQVIDGLIDQVVRCLPEEEAVTTDPHEYREP